VVVGWWWEEEKSGVRTRVFSQSCRCQARHIPEMECAALAFVRDTFTQCAACELNVPGVRMYVCAALGIYPYINDNWYIFFSQGIPGGSTAFIEDRHKILVAFNSCI
jgi:hypothetical protein